MAQLESPGVSVTVIDESFYTPAAPGTVPLIVVASAENKENGSGTGVATATLKANAGVVELLTSQKDLSDKYGVPFFETDANNNPVHAGEMNEYGLQAAYSFLGVSNSAYVVRADIDLAQLESTESPPNGGPVDGAMWIDTDASQYGVFEWNSAPASVLGGQTFTVKHPVIITDSELVEDFNAQNYAPKASYGKIGNYALVAVSNLMELYYKKTVTGPNSAVEWVRVGSPEWVASWPIAQGSIYSSSINLLVSDTFTITVNGTPTSITGLSGAALTTLVTEINSANIPGVTAGQGPGQLQIFSTGASITLSGSSVAKVGLSTGTYIAPALSISPHTQVPTYKIRDNLSTVRGNPTGSIWVKTTPYNAGANWNVKLYDSATSTWNIKTAPLYASNSAALRALDSTGGGINLAGNTVYLKYNNTEELVSSYPAYANFKLYRRRAVGPTTITSAIIKSDTITGTSVTAVAASVATNAITFNALTTAVVVPKGAAITTASNATGGGISASTTYYAAAAFTIPTTGTVAVVVAPTYADAMDAGGARASFTGGSVTNGQVTISYPKTYEFTLAESVLGSSTINAPVTVSFTVTNGDTAVQTANAIAEAINNLSFVNIEATVTSTNQLVIKHLIGGEIEIVDITNAPMSLLYSVSLTANFYESSSGLADAYVASNWTCLNEEKTGGFASASPSQPTALTLDGALWYDSDINDVDIMVHNGTTWVGYRHADLGDGIGATDINGPIVSASKPTKQSTGALLQNGDLWIDTSDLENYPRIYKFVEFNQKWELVDNTDQTTENGVIFHDARWDTTGMGTSEDTIADLLLSDFLDFDAPDPALYPKGMLLWNLRRSGFNVKKFVHNYVDIEANNTRYNNDEPMQYYYPNRWISVAANQADGAGSFGRKAQRAVVIQAMAALINSNQQIRDEDSKIFNLLAAPGYPELIKPLVTLNTDRGQTAFIVGDTPARLAPDSTLLSNWGNNVNNALIDCEDGIVTTDPYVGMFYPWGYTTDNIGNNVAVPPSHIMLRTIALNDNVSYPWFAPAGVRRGMITNASAVGYVDSEGEFNSIALNNGQRDVLANIHVNPLTYISGTGLVNYGQKTRQLVASALDRINVARLVIYMRVQLARIAKPYIFEPNDTQTRNEIKQQIENFLLELVGQRALYDFLVVCDRSNNTDTRIDRNELWVDIAIEPVKAVEFIYIPLRLENTGAIAKLGQK